MAAARALAIAPGDWPSERVRDEVTSRGPTTGSAPSAARIESICAAAIAASTRAPRRHGGTVPFEVAPDDERLRFGEDHDTGRRVGEVA